MIENLRSDRDALVAINGKKIHILVTVTFGSAENIQRDRRNFYRLFKLTTDDHALVLLSFEVPDYPGFAGSVSIGQTGIAAVSMLGTHNCRSKAVGGDFKRNRRKLAQQQKCRTYN